MVDCCYHSQRKRVPFLTFAPAPHTHKRHSYAHALAHHSKTCVRDTSYRPSGRRVEPFFPVRSTTPSNISRGSMDKGRKLGPPLPYLLPYPNGLQVGSRLPPGPSWLLSRTCFKDILDLHSVNMTRMDKFLHPLPVTRQRSTSVTPSHYGDCLVIAGSHHLQYCWILQSHVSEEEKFVIHIDLP